MKTFISNHKFLIKDLYGYSKSKINLIWLNVLAGTIVVFLGLKLSELVVALVTNPVEPKIMMLELGRMVGILSIFSILELVIRTKRANISEKYRVSHITKASEVIIDTKFENLLTEEFNEYRRITMDSISGPHSLLGVYIEHLTTWLTQLVQLIFIGSLVFLLDLPMIFYVLFLIIITMIYRTYQAKIIKEHKKEASLEHHKITYLTEKSSNFKVAKDMRLYAVKPWFKEIYDFVQGKINKIIFKQTRVILGGQFLSSLIISLITGYGYFIFVQKYINNIISLSELTLYTGALSTLLINSSSLVNATFDLIQDSNDITKVRKYYSYVDQYDINEKKISINDVKSIEFKNVSFKYPGSDSYILENFNLYIEDFENLAIVGLNGAGKTTLVKLLTNLIKPSSGEILINGISNQEIELENYFDLFSVVFQDQHTLPMTIKEAILQSNEYNEERYNNTLIDSGMDKVIDNFPLKDNTPLIQALESEGVTLSGGQTQKLKLAQALYKNGQILVLDEPTAALDAISESEIYENYFKLAKDRISIFISHRLSSTQFCDRIIYIEDGAIVEDGTHKSLMKLNGKYKYLFDKQSHYYKKELNLNEK